MEGIKIQRPSYPVNDDKLGFCVLHTCSVVSFFIGLFVHFTFVFFCLLFETLKLQFYGLF